MTLEIRPTDAADRLNLYDGDDWIGEIRDEPLDEECIAAGDPPYWTVKIWSLMGTGKEWNADGESLDEAKLDAHELYKEFVAERRELSRGARPRTVSTPMGGQRRK